MDTSDSTKNAGTRHRLPAAPDRIAELTDEISHVFDTVREPLLALDGTDLCIRLANQAFYRKFGVSREDTEGHFIYELGNGQWNIPELRRKLEEIIPRQDSFSDFEVDHTFERIGRRIMLLNGRKIDRGRLVLLAIEDITDRRYFEEELKRSNRELEQFAYVASHDLKEPLRTIRSHLTLLRKNAPQLRPKDAESLHFAMDGATRMSALIDSLLSYAHVGRRERPERIDLNGIFEEARQALSLSIGECGARVTSDALPTVQGDGKELEQLFQNLISNGIKYRSAAVPEIHVGARQQTQEWLFSVRDNGIGIEQADQSHVFEMFRRLHPASDYPGTGIGLAICRKIVELHGGRIWVVSEPGSGSTFYFTLPA